MTNEIYWKLAEHLEQLKELSNSFLDICLTPEDWDLQIILDWDDELSDIVSCIDNVLVLESVNLI